MTDRDVVARARRQRARCHWLDAVIHAELVATAALVTLSLGSYAYPWLVRAAIASLGCWVFLRVLRGGLLFRARAEHQVLRRYVEEHLARRERP